MKPILKTHELLSNLLLMLNVLCQIDPVYSKAEKKRHYSQCPPHRSGFDLCISLYCYGWLWEMRAGHCPSIKRYGCQPCPIAGPHHSKSVGRPSVFGWGGAKLFNRQRACDPRRRTRSALCTIPTSHTLLHTHTEPWSRSLHQTPFSGLWMGQTHWYSCEGTPFL